jgi:hypothetical protein
MKRLGVLVLLLALAGCLSTPDGPEVATAGSGPAPGPASTQSVLEQYVEGVRAYVRCMRDNGIELPDPGPRGEIDLSVLGPPGQAKRDPQYLTASQRCQSLLPPMPAELVDQGPPLTPEQVEYVRRYAACMRENGVPTFPDPDENGRLPRNDVMFASTESEAAAIWRAGQICEPLLNGGPTGTPDPAYPGGQG